MTEVAADAPAGRPTFRVIDADASPEEVAAIVAAIASLQPDVVTGEDATERSRWLDTSRRAARRVGIARGDWRLSGRVARRARA